MSIMGSRRVVRAVWGSIAVVVLVAVGGLFLFPTRTYIDQRHQLAVASEQLRVLDGQNNALAQQVDKLHTDAEIERIAREQYHLVKPGEKAYAILPAPVPTTTVPTAPVRHHSSRGLWQRLTSWL